MAGEEHRRALTTRIHITPNRMICSIALFFRLFFFCFFAWPASASADTPLHAAAEHNDHKTAAALIADGADVNATDAHGDTPLHKAALQNAREATALLIGNGANVDAKNRFGATPLHYAASQNARTIAALLITNGADVNAADQLALAPLHWAARENAFAMADWLIGKGANAISGWFWFYNYSANRDSWRRGKAWFDDDMRQFLALEKKRTDQAKKTSATKNIAIGVAGCAILGGGGCAQVASNSAVNWIRETEQIKQWESQLSEINADASVHAARFLVPPNEQSRPVTISGERPFTRYVGKLVTGSASCTAFLVRPKIALTNSHCVCRDNQCRNRILPRTMRLTFARKDLTGEHDVAVGVRKVYTNDFRTNLQNDYAFLILNKAPNLGGHLEVAPTAGDTETIATAGYPGDLLDGKVMTALWGCRLQAKASILFFADPDCHNYKGASGSPYIAVDGHHRGKVVGINSFGRTDNEGVGGGPAASSFYSRLREVIGKEER